MLDMFAYIVQMGLTSWKFENSFGRIFLDLILSLGLATDTWKINAPNNTKNVEN